MKLWHLAKFLEEIPSKLPGSGHPYRHIIPVEQFSRYDMGVYLTWLCGWFGFGGIAVSIYSLLWGTTYLFLGPVAYGIYLYLACTKCPYFGKRCYMGGGQCARYLFEARHADYTLLEDLTIPLLWIGISLYPVIFLIYYQSWLLLLCYTILAIGWQIFHKRNICVKCLNIRCALNPRFAGRTGRV